MTEIWIASQSLAPPADVALFIRFVLFAKHPLTAAEVLHTLLIDCDRPSQQDPSNAKDERCDDDDDTACSDDSERSLQGALNYFRFGMLSTSYDKGFVEDEMMRPCGMLIELCHRPGLPVVQHQIVQCVHL